MSSKTSSKRRYQPAAEFDDATIARKREYWRSKKREQRARKSSTKKKIGNENLRMSVVSEASSDPSLHNNNVSFKQEEADAPKNSFSLGLSVSESNITMVPCQKARWFQRTKLNYALPQSPETSTNTLKGVMGNKKINPSDTGSSKINASTVESLCPTVHSVPRTCIELHPNNTHAQKSKSGMSSLNDKHLTTSLQSHVSMVLPVHSYQNKPQNSLRLLTSAECKVCENQSPITKRRTCAFILEHNTGEAVTEEEMVAKRRENWRIKKREQRAKRAAKLARDREGSLRQGQPLSVGIMNASSPTNSKALRGISLNSNLASLNQQLLGAKFNGSQTAQLHVKSPKPNHASLTSGILQSSSSKSKSKVQKFAQTQKRRQNQMRRSTLGASKVESPEDRHARQKEYWRIKKREQRARLSMALKARLKEQEALKHHGRHSYNSFSQACGVQASKASAFAVSSDTIGGFIKEDGTVTVSISKTSPKASLPASQDISNVKYIGNVKLQVQVNSPLYSDAPPVTKLDSAQCNISRNCTNAHQNSPVKSRLTRGAVMGSMTVTIKSETPTEEERVTRLREYWRIKKRQQRASRAARLGNGLLRSKVSVLKQREQNKKSNHRQSITSSITTTVCHSSTSAPMPIKEEHVYPTIQAVFSIPEITPCISVNSSKTSPSASLESHIEPPTAVDHHATTLQAVPFMKLLEESVYTPEENNASEMHVKCENEPLPLNKDELFTSKDAKPSLTLQQNVLLQCDLSKDTSLIKDIKLSPQASTFENISHYKTLKNVCQEATDGSHAISPVALQPQNFSENGADPKQPSPIQALQKQQLGESDELQRKREYWRLKKRQQRARKTNKDATKNAVLRSLPQKKTQSTTFMQAMSQDTLTCRQILIQKKTSRCTKPSSPQTQPTDKSRCDRSQIVATANPQEDPEEVISRRRMQWRIKKQEQRARKAAREKRLRQVMVPPQSQDLQSQNSTSLCSAVVQSVTLEDQLGYFVEPCQPALKEESSFAPNDAMEGPLSLAEWRNVYLMDFDPVNPLLVCMVCGEQQYSESVEGVKAHIEEAHPETLSLGDLERQGILDAWDKQVAVREHFITHQLQQQCRPSTNNTEICFQSGFENMK
ncbi:uncharacterized protein si:dkey-28a3.2 [Carassius carassius]|uniref:uncharacterized protein si:dkey-28a3.2 n=1 Tax=Carassius carassius TaxID=217509 RepID=UPI002868E21E|nr:uncharacterized protein si:dkey-28a3.2 [Carassius carassius]